MSGNSDSPGKARARAAGDVPLSAREQEYFEKLLHLFCLHLRGTHGCAESTITLYRGILLRAVCEIGCPPWTWQPHHTDLLLSEQAERGLTFGTQSVSIAGLRRFQNWFLADIGLCNEVQQKFGFRPQPFITTENSIAFRRKGRESSKVITPLEPEQCTALLNEFQFQIEVARQRSCKSYKTLRRDYVMTVVALSYGLRMAELAGIELPHFMSDPKHLLFGQFAILRVIGKGSKERPVRLYAPVTAKVLKWYVKRVRPAFLTKRTQNTNVLFLSERGCTLSHRQYRRTLASTAAAAGLKVRVYPHLLRHTYGTEMAPIIGAAALQQQMGHKYLSTTLRYYYHQDPERVGDEVRQGIDTFMARFDEITEDASDAHHR